MSRSAKSSRAIQPKRRNSRVPRVDAAELTGALDVINGMDICQKDTSERGTTSQRPCPDSFDIATGSRRRWPALSDSQTPSLVKR